jgi:hypothetical protein
MGDTEGHIALHRELAIVANYVESQERHHQKRTLHEEFLELLVKHGVAYDPNSFSVECQG